MVKLTVIYNHPTDPTAFEQHYNGTHVPLALKMDVARLEFTLFSSSPDGSRPAFHRMAELYFRDATHMASTLASPAGRTAVDDIPKFATGGATVVVGSVQTPIGV